MGRLTVDLCGIPLDNPVIPASGTFGYGYEFAELYDINCLGTFSFKGTTREPRFGNPTPRIAECTAGMINAVGLQNPGVDAVIAEELPKLKQCFRKPVMANVSGFSVEEYAETCEKLDEEPQVGWLEVNVSCPNVHGGGMSFGTDPKAAAEVVKAVKAVTTKPVLIKLTPNVTDIVAIAKACEEAGAELQFDPYTNYVSYRVDPESTTVKTVLEAFGRMGIEPLVALGGGGSDANIYNQKGIESVVLGTGMTKVHTTEETITVENLYRTAVLAQELLTY